MRRASTVVASAAHPTSPAADAWVSASLSFQGLKALGVPQDSLDRGALGDTGESSPANWETPLGTPDVHVVLTAIAPARIELRAALRPEQPACTNP